MESQKNQLKEEDVKKETTFDRSEYIGKWVGDDGGVAGKSGTSGSSGKSNPDNYPTILISASGVRGRWGTSGDDFEK